MGRGSGAHLWRSPPRYGGSGGRFGFSRRGGGGRGRLRVCVFPGLRCYHCATANVRGNGMIIAIDGPAGSGKSTIAQAVAARLGLTFLGTGAMYRAVTLVALEKGVSLDDDDALGALALDLEFEFSQGLNGETKVRVDGRDVTEEIRGPSVSQKVSFVAAHRKVRNALT